MEIDVSFFDTISRPEIESHFRYCYGGLSIGILEYLDVLEKDEKFEWIIFNVCKMFGNSFNL